MPELWRAVPAGWVWIADAGSGTARAVWWHHAWLQTESAALPGVLGKNDPGDKNCPGDKLSP